MKKLVLFVAVIVAVSFASCKKNAQAPVENQTPAQEEVTPEPAAADTVAADTAVVAQ
jgi:PBP1b-binding outer membrane lipoprotein LpoB